MERWFIDTSFLIAISARVDQHQDRASQLLNQIEENGIALVTTSAILLEFGAALSRLAFRTSAATVIREMQNDERIKIVSVHRELLEQALALFESRPDKEWSVADCASFEVMRSRGMSQALTADKHFEQAEFVALRTLA